MSAIPPEADIGWQPFDDRCVPEADITPVVQNDGRHARPLVFEQEVASEFIDLLDRF